MIRNEVREDKEGSDHAQSYRILYESEFKRITLATFWRMNQMRTRDEAGRAVRRLL